MIEVRIHGRGGQGAVTASEILAVAAGYDGKYSQAFPFFGVERRGAPVMAFTRIDDKPIRVHQHVYNPDIIVVLDPTIPEEIYLSGKKENTQIIINGKDVDATAIALDVIGKPIVNTAMLGALVKKTGIVSLDSLKKAVYERFGERLGEVNWRAVMQTYEKT